MDNRVNDMVRETLDLGAYGAGAIDIVEVVFDRKFRSICESNACGNLGKCWTCPPDIGDIDKLIDQARSFDGAIIYQTVRSIEDSFDFEGMMEAGRLHNVLAEKINKAFASRNLAAVLHLGAGGCHVCDVCARGQDLPCRHPDRAMASLEAYGVDVSQLAEAAGLNYTNGQNTVTYFGAYFYRL